MMIDTEKFVVTVKIERVVHDQLPTAKLSDGSCRGCGYRSCRCAQPRPTERKVDTVASVVVTASGMAGAVGKAKAHLDAELVDHGEVRP